MSSSQIPNPVLYVVGDVLGTWYYSHTRLNTLFGENGAPGDPPEGNCITKCRIWLKRVNDDPEIDAIAFLGKMLVEFMSWDGHSDPRWRKGYDRIQKVLADSRLAYHPSGMIVTIDGPLPSPSMETLAGPPLNSVERTTSRSAPLSENQSVGRPRVYISYSWWEKRAKERALKLADQLREARIDAHVDLYYQRGLHGFTAPALRQTGEDAWTRWQKEQIRDADRVLLICGPEYANSPPNSGVARDLRFMQDDLKRPGVELRKFIPVGFAHYSQNKSNIPPFLKGANYYNLARGSKIGGLKDLIHHFRNEFPMQGGTAPLKVATPVRTTLPKGGSSESVFDKGDAARPVENDPSKIEVRMAKKHVFLSYCHDNEAEVAQLHADLLAAGEVVWWDKDILPGKDWKQEIRRAMKGSYAVVLCLSKQLAARIESGVYPEVSDAIGFYRKQAPGSVFLIPVRLSNCELPDIEIDDTRTLDRLQATDLFPASKRATGLQRLLAALKASPSHP